MSDLPGEFLAPCGSCRELLAEHGEFPVYLVQLNRSIVKRSTKDLLPLSIGLVASNRAADSLGDAKSPRVATHNPNVPGGVAKSGFLLESASPHEWTVEQVRGLQFQQAHTHTHTRTDHPQIIITGSQVA